MPFFIRCVSCEKKLKVPDHYSGKRGKCPACGAAIIFAPSTSDGDDQLDSGRNELSLKTVTKDCPHCGQAILAAAQKCKHCKRWVEKPPETSLAGDKSPALPDSSRWMAEKENLRKNLPERLRQGNETIIGVANPEFDILVEQVELDDLGGEIIIARCYADDNLLLMTTRKVVALYIGGYGVTQEYLTQGDDGSTEANISTLTSTAGMALAGGWGMDMLAGVAKSAVGMLAGGWLGKKMANAGKDKNMALFSAEIPAILAVNCATCETGTFTGDVDPEYTESIGVNGKAARSMLTLRCSAGGVDIKTTKASLAGSNIEFLFGNEMFDHMVHVADEIKRRVKACRAQEKSVESSAPSQNAFMDDPLTQLKKLSELRDIGVISAEEFDEKKKELLSRI